MRSPAIAGLSCADSGAAPSMRRNHGTVDPVKALRQNKYFLLFPARSPSYGNNPFIAAGAAGFKAYFVEC